MSDFSNKVILITGAGSGIGRAAAILYAEQHGTVIVSDRNIDGGQETVQQITSAGGKAEFIACDVGQHDQVQALIQEVIDRHGRIDIAVNNAGIMGSSKRTADIEEADFDRIMNVNVKGVWLCMKYEIPHMIAQGGGSIVNIASVAGLVGSHSLSVYGASKHAVIGLTKSAALEYARKSIRVNAICPAVISTPMVNVEAAQAMNPQFMQATLAANPSRRLGEADEVARAIVWISSDAASFTTGATLTVDGGFTAQ